MKNAFITDHAHARFFERGGNLCDIQHEIKHATPWGTQSGDGFMWLCPCGLIAAGRKLWTESGHVWEVKTFLLPEQAMVNIQSQCLHRIPRLSKRTGRAAKKGIKERQDRERMTRTFETQQRIEWQLRRERRRRDW